MAIEHRTIVADWQDAMPQFTADVVIGDGQTDFDEDYPFDDRVLFYFHDEAEFERAKTDPEVAGFLVVSS